MHKILFRAKRKDTSEWIEGYYVKVKDYLTEKDIHVIIPSDVTLFPRNEFAGYEHIFPETLCRLIDPPCYDGVWNDNRRFFEGDIIGVYSKLADIDHEEPDSIAIVINEFCITENGLGRWFPQGTIITKVIGNVYDTPELVGKECANLYRYNYGFRG